MTLSTMLSSVPITWALAALVPTASIFAQTETECTLQCFNQGICAFGQANFDDHPQYNDGSSLTFLVRTSNNAGMHCVCPYGWTGLQCDVPFEICYNDGDDTENESVNAQRCYHGGQCIPGLLDHYGNSQLFCDCSEALDLRGVPYVGKYCEHQVAQRCSGSSLGAVERYCVNDGTCNPNYMLDE
jgi:hypothetical protein